MPKITVISYCHQAHGKWIPHWIEQIQRQTTQDFDIVFVFHNWKGTSGLAGPALTMKQAFGDRVRCFDHCGPPVIGDVIDFAASKVETEFLAHHDLDDIIHPDRIRIQERFLEGRPDVDFLGTRMVGFYGDPKPEMLELGYIEPNEPNLKVMEHEDIKRCLFRGQNCLGHTTMVYRPQALLSLGGFSRSDVKLDGKSPDFETWKKAIMAGYKFHRLPQLCALWRLDSSSIRL